MEECARAHTLTHSMHKEYFNSCLVTTGRAHMFDQGLGNSWRPVKSGVPVLPGTTYLHNQWLSLGHAPMESTLLKAVSELNVSRVVVQRVVDYFSDTETESSGASGSWDTWYHDYFRAAAELGAPRALPVYLRFKNDTSRWYPLVFHTRGGGSGSGGGSGGGRGGGRGGSSAASLRPLSNRKSNLCFEHVVLQSHHDWPSPEAAAMFVREAYAIAGVSPTDGNTLHDAPFVCCIRYSTLFVDLLLSRPYRFEAALSSGSGDVLLSLRTHDREMDDSSARDLAKRIEQKSGGLVLRRFLQAGPDTSFINQVRAVATAGVVVSTHGAFMTNIMWLAPPERGTAPPRRYVELRGDYMYTNPRRYKTANIYFRLLAETFRVDLQQVCVANLTSHRQLRYRLSEEEIGAVVDLARRTSRVEAVVASG